MRQASIIWGSNSGGCCKSQSSVITAAPRAASSPARSAACWPKLRPKRINRTRGWRSRKLRIRSAVASKEPSSTKIISQTSSPRREDRTASKTAGIFASSLKAGITTLIIALQHAAGPSLFMGKNTRCGSYGIKVPATIKSRSASDGGGVETELIERQWEPEDIKGFVEMVEQYEDFARSIQMFMAHDGPVIESAPKAVFNSSGKTPSQAPQRPPFAGKSGTKCPAVAEQEAGTSQNERKVPHVLQDGNGQNAVVAHGLRDFLKI